MSQKVNPALIGTFVVSGILLAVAGVMVFGSGEFLDRKRTFVSFFPGSVNGLVVGSDVSFRGVRVGTVTDILLFLEPDSMESSESMRIPVVFDLDETLLQERGASISLDDAALLQDLMARGLSARLDTESLLTGRLYVSLDFRPGSEPAFSGVEHEFPEIPTVRSPMAEVGDRAREVADRLLQVDLERLFASLDSTLVGLNRFATNEDLQALPGSLGSMAGRVEETLVVVQDVVEVADSAVGPVADRVMRTAERAEASMAQVDETMASLRGVVDPSAPLVSGLVATLQELQRATRSLRRVTEMLEREPSAVLRGRSAGGGDR